MVQIVSFPFLGYGDWHKAGLEATGKTFQILENSWGEYTHSVPKGNDPELVICDYSALPHTARCAVADPSVAFLRNTPIVLGGDAQDITSCLTYEERKLNIVAVVPYNAQFEPRTFVALSNAFDVAKWSCPVTAQTFGEALKTIEGSSLRPSPKLSAWAYIPAVR